MISSSSILISGSGLGDLVFIFRSLVTCSPPKMTAWNDCLLAGWSYIKPIWSHGGDGYLLLDLATTDGTFVIAACRLRSVGFVARDELIGTPFAHGAVAYASCQHCLPLDLRRWENIPQGNSATVATWLRQILHCIFTIISSSPSGSGLPSSVSNDCSASSSGSGTFLPVSRPCSIARCL